MHNKFAIDGLYCSHSSSFYYCFYNSCNYFIFSLTSNVKHLMIFYPLVIPQYPTSQISKNVYGKWVVILYTSRGSLYGNSVGALEIFFLWTLWILPVIAQIFSVSLLLLLQLLSRVQLKIRYRDFLAVSGLELMLPILRVTIDPWSGNSVPSMVWSNK